MRRADTARLLLLAAIWGASFLFMRIAAPVLGPVLTAELRTLIAGVALAAYFAATGFLLWAYAALSLGAGLLSVLNATAPMFGALCSALLLHEKLSARRILGLVIGV